MDGACQHEAGETAARPPHFMVDALRGARSFDVSTGLTHGTIEMMNDVHRQDLEAPAPCAEGDQIQWRSRYDGLVTIAELGGKAVAGISGPWSGQYALTWWDRPLPTRSLELFNSLDQAKREVEDWARRMRTGNYSMPHRGIVQYANRAARTAPTIAPADVVPIVAVASARPAIAAPASLLGWVRGFLPNLQTQKAGAVTTSDVGRVRLQREDAELELGDDLHFSADK